MLQLPLVLFIVMVEVSVGAVSVLVFLDWRNEVKRGFLISYAFIYLVLAGLTYLFQQNFATPALLNTYAHLDTSWTGQEALPLLLFFLLLVPYSFFLVLDKHAGVGEIHDEMEEGNKAIQQQQGSSTLRMLRLISGGATMVAGLAALFALAMIFHPLVASTIGGVCIVASFFAAAFALGGVMTAMWLGHWYLVTPALSERPLQFSTTVVLVAVLAQVGFSLAAGPSLLFGSQTTLSSSPAVVAVPTRGSEIKPLDAPQITPLSSDAIGWIHILVGFVMPLVLGGLAWKLIRDRSFQSATGMLYLVVVCALAGEAMARGLFLGHL